MPREYKETYKLHDAKYFEKQSRLLAEFDEKNKEITEYLREIKNVIMDDIRDAVKEDKRASMLVFLITSDS